MYQQPWILVQNKVRAEGGREIDIFRGVPDPKDTQNGAEAWIGSVTRANGVTPDNPNLGCAEVILPDGRKRYLFEVIEENPDAVLGSRHIERFGSGLGILVKYLDAKREFLLQCHPTRKTARELWNNDYGKTECWHVLNTRNDVDEPAHIWLGFKPGVTREAFEKAYRTCSIYNMEPVKRLCHKFPVHAGETYFIPGGMPHALGVGCFVIEIQEPSDLTAVPIPQKDLIAFRKKANPSGEFSPIDDSIYEKQMLGSFDYTGRALSDVFAFTRTANPVIRSGIWGEERLIVGPRQTQYFSCTEINIHGQAELKPTGEIRIGIVTSGSGEIITPYGRLQVVRGSELFFPYAVDNVTVNGNISIVLSHPAGAHITV